MSATLALHIRQRHWELVSLYLLLGMARALQHLPPDAALALVELLGGDDDER